MQSVQGGWCQGERGRPATGVTASWTHASAVRHLTAGGKLAQLRPQVELLKARNAAMMELLECVARGGYKDAHEIVETIRGYDLVLVKRDEAGQHTEAP